MELNFLLIYKIVVCKKRRVQIGSTYQKDKKALFMSYNK